MEALIKLALGSLSSVWGYVAIGAVSAVIAASSVGYITHQLDNDTYLALQLKDAKAATAIAEQTTEAVTAEKNIEIAEVSDVRDAAIAEAARQPVLVTRIRNVITTVPTFISPAVNTRTCIPNGFVELLNNAIRAGNSEDGTATPTLASGQSNDSCTASDVSDLAEQIIGSIIIPASANAEQLNALELAITKQINDYNMPVSSPPESMPSGP